MRRRFCPLCLFAVTATACADDPAPTDDTLGSSGSSTSVADSGTSLSSGNTGSTEGSESGESSTGGTGVDDTGVPAACASASDLRGVVDALADAEDPRRGWLDITHGKMARVSFASGAIWTRRTANGTGVLVSALHVQGLFGGGQPNGDAPAVLVDPTVDPGLIGTSIVQQGGEPATYFNAHFLLQHPAVPAGELANGLTGIHPRHDYFMGVIDGQQVQDTKPIMFPDPLDDDALPLWDPESITTAEPTTAAVAGGDRVLYLGFPADAGPISGQLAFGVAEVLDDAAAELAIAELADVGDEEGSIPYDAEAEMMWVGPAGPGMSGGGVFDEAGRHVGILVRATTTVDKLGIQYVRATRMAFVRAQVQTQIDALDPPVREAVLEYLEPLPGT